MCDRQAFRAATAPNGFGVKKVAPPDSTLNRRFYCDVGCSWEWTDRLAWSADDWHRYVHRNALVTYVGHLDGQEVGYFELEAQEAGDVEIVYLGLLPDFIGRGLGRSLLSSAIERAWQMMETQRVWVHTCTEDHDHALGNYLQRGFVLFKTENV